MDVYKIISADNNVYYTIEVTGSRNILTLLKFYNIKYLKI